MTKFFLVLFLLSVSFPSFGNNYNTCIERSFLFPTFGVPLKEKVINASANFLGGIKVMKRIYMNAMAKQPLFPNKSPWRLMLETMNIGFKTNIPIQGAIPKKGSVVVIANHPFGGLDWVSALDIVLRNRKDVKLMINRSIAERMPELRGIGIPVEMMSRSAEAKAYNQNSLREAVEHVEAGGALIIFPAGRVADSESLLKSFGKGMENKKTTDQFWKPGISSLVTIKNTSVVPMYFQGGNSQFYYAFQKMPLIGKFYEGLLVHEILNKKALDINIAIGDAIKPDVIQEIFEAEGKKGLVQELRRRTDELADIEI